MWVAIIITLILVSAFFYSFTYINDPRVQGFIFSNINKVSSLDIVSANVNIDLWHRTISANNIVLQSEKKGQEFKLDSISFKFGLLALLRGHIKLSDMTANTLEINISQKSRDIEKIERPKIGLANLLLMRNLVLKNGVIENTVINLPLSKTEVGKVWIDFDPSIFGNIDLGIKISAVNYSPENNSPISVENIIIDGKTDVNNWIDVFPYVDDISGNFELQTIKWKSLSVENLKTKLSYVNKSFDVNSFEASINGQKLKIKGEVNGKNGEYTANIDIPEPIYLPHLARATSFLDTSGRLQGSVHIKGKGLDYKTTSATADISLTHTLEGDTPLPVELRSKVNIAGGKMNIASANLKIGDANVEVGGNFDYLDPDLQLNFAGKNIPAETVMNRFLLKHYHPAKALTNVSGTFTGWKPNLKFNLHVEGVDGSYYELTAPRLKMDLEMTYNNLTMTGSIFDGETAVGKVDLKMTMGEKLPDGTRNTNFDLTAKVDNADLSRFTQNYGLLGTGSGEIHLTGKPKAFTGSGKANVAGGSFKNIGFSNLSSDIKFATKKIEFTNIRISSTEANSATAYNPVVLDVLDDGVHVSGKPRVGIDIDARYHSGNKSWQIANVSYASVERPEWKSSLSGTVSESGGLNLRMNGMFDISILQYLRGLVREAQGPVELKGMTISGTSNDPAISGEMILHDNSVQPTGWGYFIDKLSGTLKFSGHTITLPDVRGRIEYGDFTLKGSLEHKNLTISNTDLQLNGKSIMYATKDRSFRMEFDCDLKLNGGPTGSTLSGKIDILDGRYTKDFSVFEKLRNRLEIPEEEAGGAFAWKNMKLALRVKSNGDLRILNNVGEIFLNADLNLGGTVDAPRIVGNIDTTGGEIKYAGLDFEITRGFLEFRDPYKVPYIEFVSAKEVGSYNVLLTIRGNIDKLYFDLESTPPLDRRDVMALLTSGMTGNEINDARFGYQTGTGLAAEQLTSILSKPLSKITTFDRFQIETAPGGVKDTTRVNVSKKLTDRLRVNFITDVNPSNTVQTFEAEYLLTDHVLLKGSGTTDARYRFDLTFRFAEQ